MRPILLLGAMLWGLAPATLWAQAPGVRERLLARGAPEDFAGRVAAIVEGAASRGLPVEPLEAKALEGWAKRARVPPDRVVVVLERLSGLLEAGRAAAQDAGLGSPSGAVVAAAAEALGRGLTADDVGEVIRSAPAPEAAAAGLTVAASLAAQGLERAAAVKAVTDVLREGRGAPDVLELPSAVAALQARGVPMADVARQILQGGGLPLPSVPGGPGAGRPPGVPPGRGPPIEPPGKPETPGPPGQPPGS